MTINKKSRRRQPIKNIIRVVSGVIFFLAHVAILWSLEKDFRLEQVIDGGSYGSPVVFAAITGAAATSCGDIIICDWKQNVIAKFNRQGKFLKTIGRKGNGPGDFNMIRAIIHAGKYFYALDQGNNRIARFDENLENLSYIKLAQDLAMPDSFHSLSSSGDVFLLTPFFTPTSVSKGEKGGRIVMLNGNFQVQGVFFNERPWLGGEAGLSDRSDPRVMGKLDILSVPVLGTDPANQRILVTFASPDNPLRFFLYKAGGRLVKSFSHAVDKAHRFNRKLISGKSLTFGDLRDTRSLGVGVIFFVNECWYVLVKLKRYGDIKPGATPKADVRYLYLKFSGDGELLRETEAKRGLTTLCVTMKGDLLCTDLDGETPQLEIYGLK